jgi:hypothetical protein
MPRPTRHNAPAQPTAPTNGNGHSKAAAAAGATEKGEVKILFQKNFKSVGPRSYSAQIKEATNGNHVLILTEGKRDSETDEVKKTKVFVYSEDFGTFFRMLHETAQWIRMNPVPEEIKRRRQRFWAKHNAAGDSEPETPPAKTIAAPPPQARPGRASATAKPRPVAPSKAAAKKPPARRAR